MEIFAQESDLEKDRNWMNLTNENEDGKETRIPERNLGNLLKKFLGYFEENFKRPLKR